MDLSLVFTGKHSRQTTDLPTINALNKQGYNMDDVWGNAWSQPEEDVAHVVPPKAKLGDVPPWSFPSPSPSAAADEEADVGTPSWSTGDVNWTEPTGQTSLWSNTSAAEDLSLGTDGWTTNPNLEHDFERVDGKQVVDEPTTHASQADNEPEDTPGTEEHQSRSTTPDSVRTVTSAVDLGALSRKTESSEPSSGFEVSEAEGSETFGSFENGIESVSPAFGESTTAWTSPIFNDANAEEKVWGSAWETPESSEDNDEVPKDEWTIAREAKERQDRSVPPELRAAIFERLNELISDLWPNESKVKLEQDLGNWRDGLSSVSGFEETVQKCLPETQFQPPIRFSESRTARAMAQSLKLSKNLPIARNSPMSHLFTAKSVAAWEISVKSKVEIPKDDIPVGWKTVEPAEERESKPVSVERKSGGILSFFGKRTSAVTSPSRVSSDMDSKRSSFSQEITSDATSGPPAARNSSDANSLASKIHKSSSVSSLSSIPPAPLRSPSAASFSTSPLPSSSPAPPSSSTRPHATSAEEATAPAPSVVSRFLNRFSRTKSDMRSNSTSPRNSIALSTNDLEFLSDIVPSHSDDADGIDQLDTLTTFVSTPAVPEKLPPPLAPPPLVPPPMPSSVNRSHTPQPRFQQLLPSASAPKPDNSFGELESLKLGNRYSADIPRSNGSMFAALPPALPPPLSPTSVGSSSRPPTPSPLSGGALRTVPARTFDSSPPPRILSPPASFSSPYQTSQIQHSGTDVGRFSPLNTVVSSAGSLSVGGSVRTSPAQSNPHPGLPNTFSIPPPPVEKSPNRIFALPTTTSFDDDEFSEFQSHTTPSMERSSTNQTHLASSSDLNFDPFPSHSVSSRQVAPVQTDLLGDFDDFMSTSVSPPPAVPKEASSDPLSSPAGIPPPLPKKQVPANLNTLHTRKPSASDHDAAARLVERAAAHQGRWPAPLSPLPEPLSPPPVGVTNSTTAPSRQSILELIELNRNGVNSRPPFSSVHSIALKPIAHINPPTEAREQVVSPPPLLAPPKSSGSLSKSVVQASLLDLGETPHPSGPPSGTPQALLSPFSINDPPALSAGSAKSNLSAQDLSFFEGL